MGLPQYVIDKIVIDFNKNRSMKFLILSILFTTSILLFPDHSFAQTPTVPDPPPSLTASPISPTTVSMYWSPPQHNGSRAITSYEIDFKTVKNPNYGILATTSNVTKYNATGLTTGTTYIFHVLAINVIGKSNPSPEASATPTSTSAPPKHIVPNPPQGLTTTVSSSNQISLSWGAPIDNGGPPVTGYRIDYKLDSANFTNLIANTGTSSTSFVHNSLQTGHTYTYRVFAINSIGISNSSNTASATPVQVNTIPGAPVSLSAYSASPTSISLSWNPPLNNGGSSIIGYKIEYYNGTSQFSVLVSNTGSQQTTYLHTGLVTGTSYTYRVTAINSLGSGPASNTASATPNQTTNPTITSAMAISPTQISLSWIPPSQTYGQVINGYRIDRIEGGAIIPWVDDTGSVTSYNIPNLTTGTSYAFTVTALMSGGTSSPPSSQATVTPTSTSSAPVPPNQTPSQPPSQTPGAPGAPTKLNATLISPTTVELSWFAPANNGNSPVAGYKVEYKIGAAGTWYILVSNIGVQTSYVQSGLLNGTTYVYRVSTLNNIGSSQPSNEASVTAGVQNSNQTHTPPPTIPQISAGNIPVAGTTSSINYHILAGQLMGVSVDPTTSSLDIALKANGDGIMFLQLPRDLIDAKKSDGTDIPFFVLEDKNIVSFNETKTGNYRTLAISFTQGTSDVSIHGTVAVPEFPTAYLALIIALIPVLFLSRRKIRLQ